MGKKAVGNIKDGIASRIKRGKSKKGDNKGKEIMGREEGKGRMRKRPQGSRGRKTI